MKGQPNGTSQFIRFKRFCDTILFKNRELSQAHPLHCGKTRATGHTQTAPSNGGVLVRRA